MRRSPILAGLLAALVLGFPTDALPQEDRQLTYVRESFFKLNYGDMLEFEAWFNENAAPILQEMTEAGTIQGFSSRTHDTGGPYNWRTTMRFYDWASIQPAMDEFFEKLGAAVPAADLGRVQTMIMGHHDEIWEVGDVNIAQDAGPSPYMYNASFRVNPANMARWNELVESVWKPGLEAAMAAGDLNGYVVLNHAHGGTYNWKLILLFADWDPIDDTWMAVVESAGELMGEVFSLIEEHEDEVWVTGIFGDN